MGITQSPGTRAHFRVAAIVRLGQSAAGDQHRIAGVKARIAGGFDAAGQIDAADQRIAAQDPAGAGGGERVLVVDAGVADADHHLAGPEVIELERLEARDDAAVVGVNAKSLEVFHDGRSLRRMARQPGDQPLGVERQVVGVHALDLPVGQRRAVLPREPQPQRAQLRVDTGRGVGVGGVRARDARVLADLLLELPPQARHVGDAAEVHEVHARRLIGEHAVDGGEVLLRVELRRRRRRDDEGALRGVELAVGNPEGIAGEDAAVRSVDHRVVMQRVARDMDQLERAAAELHTRAVGDHRARAQRGSAAARRRARRSAHRTPPSSRRSAWSDRSCAARRAGAAARAHWAARASTGPPRRRDRGARGSAAGSRPLRGRCRARPAPRAGRGPTSWGRRRRTPRDRGRRSHGRRRGPDRGTRYQRQ